MNEFLSDVANVRTKLQTDRHTDRKTVDLVQLRYKLRVFYKSTHTLKETIAKDILPCG